MTFGYIGLLIPWFGAVWNAAERIVTKPNEVVLVGSIFEAQLSVFSLYVFVAIICEAFRKTKLVADLMLSIDAKKEDSQENDL
jgi:hypothetical protein